MAELSPVLAALYEGRREDAEHRAEEPDVLEAAALGRLDVLRIQLEGDPEALSARTPDGFTALHLAAFFGGGGAVRMLLAAGAPADGDADNRLGVRPLHSAAAARDHDAVRALLEAGAAPDVRQHGGYTPLLQAAHADDPELTRMLLDHGADRALAADDGRDAAAMAGPRTSELLA
jgi:ankyrin repeat protein